MRRFSFLIALLTFPYLTCAKAGQLESEIILNRDASGKIVKLDATDVDYKEIIQILAVLAEKNVRVISAPDTPLTIHYKNRTPSDALKTLLNMPTLDVKTEHGTYVVSRRKPNDVR